MAASVQYKGSKAILEGFDSMEISTWALVQGGKAITGKYAGPSMEESRRELETLLRQLERSNTTTYYELRLYEDIKDRKKIRLSSEADITRNVVLFDNEDNPSPGYQRSQGAYAQLLDRMDVIDAKLALIAKEEQDDDQEEKIGGRPTGILGMIDRLLDNPRVQETLGDKLMQLAEKFLSPSPINTIPMDKQIAGMGGTGDPQQVQITQEQATKIQDALAILAGVDPQLGDHLEKIAQVAQKNPGKYRSMISMLNTFL